jgi:hypothetical protein
MGRVLSALAEAVVGAQMIGVGDQVLTVGEGELRESSLFFGGERNVDAAREAAAGRRLRLGRHSSAKRASLAKTARAGTVSIGIGPGSKKRDMALPFPRAPGRFIVI